MLNKLKRQQQSPSQPQLAESLLCLVLPQSEREDVIGAMVEVFHRDVKRYGQKKAKCYFWAQTLRELWPFIKRFIRTVWHTKFLVWFSHVIG